jgi:hypothetical protein
MVVPDGEWGAVGRDSHAVIDEAKAAGVYVFGGGIDEDVPPVLVSANGTVAMGGYPWTPTLRQMRKSSEQFLRMAMPDVSGQE